MKKRRAHGPSRKVKGTYADYSGLGESELHTRTHMGRDLEQARLEMEQRREAGLRGILHVLFLI